MPKFAFPPPSKLPKKWTELYILMILMYETRNQFLTEISQTKLCAQKSLLLNDKGEKGALCQKIIKEKKVSATKRKPLL